MVLVFPGICRLITVAGVISATNDLYVSLHFPAFLVIRLARCS